MWKQKLAIRLSLIAVFLLGSCQSVPANMPTSTALPTQAAATTLPTEAPESSHVPCFSITPEDQVPISFAPDGKGLVIKTRSGVKILDLESRKEKASIKSSQPVIAAAVSPDGEFLAWSLEDYSIELIRIADKTRLWTLKEHEDVVFRLRFSSQGDKLLSGSYDNTVKVWSIEGDLLHMIQTDDDVLGMGVSSDGTKLATVPFDGPVQLWDLTSSQKLEALGGTGGFSTSDAVFSPDGNYVAADLATGLYLWRLSDGESRWNDLKNSMAITFSPDGKYLAYSDAAENNNVFLSSPDGAEVKHVFEGMSQVVWELLFSPDSSMLAAVDSQELRIWRVEDEELMYIGKASCP